MQNDPMTPRPRNRRADRIDPSGQAAYPQQTPMQAPPAVQAPVQQHVYPQRQVPAQQRVYPQRQVPTQQRVYPQQQVPAQQRVYPQQPVNRTQPAHSTPRALQSQRQPVQSGWQMPSGPRPDTVQRRPQPQGPRPLARGSAPLDAPSEKEKQPARRLPVWLVTALAVMLIAVMGLFAAQNLMQAYLVTEEDRREAAYEAILSNYHVTESAGERRVTWQDAIERYADEYNLQPAFGAAIIRNESSFRTNAESGVGARGLMQLMPDTAQWIAGKLNDGAYTFDSMWDAETNIRYGCWYLGYLSELFRGDPVLVCAAYHAGQGDVRKWLGDRSISADGLTVPVERVPIAETRQYAGRVTQAYGIYQTLLYTNDPQLPEYAAGAGTVSVSAR